MKNVILIFSVSLGFFLSMFLSGYQNVDNFKAGKTSNDAGAGKGAFPDIFTGLTHATISTGTAYGNESKFQTASVFKNVDMAIKKIMDQYTIPAVSIAIVKDEKLVCAKSYGYADKEINRVASVDDLYRIASVSKPITAIAILKLVQDGLVVLDQKVFGENGILGNDYGIPPAGSRKDRITIRHLLEHKSGWANLPKYNSNHTQSQMFTDLVTNIPLTTSPGSTNFYLNMGYIILSRVIEKVSGESYESYVKNYILQPCGITEMRIAGKTLNDRFPKEVNYYNIKSRAEDLNLSRSAGAGGWIASATDLARFIVKIDRNTYKSDLISAKLLDQFYFGHQNWVHYGSGPGTSAVLCKLNKTFSFAILANTRVRGNGELLNDILKNTMKEQINLLSHWPTNDLF